MYLLIFQVIVITTRATMNAMETLDVKETESICN